MSQKRRELPPHLFGCSIKLSGQETYFGGKIVQPILNSMLHHISFGVRELALSGAFYDAALGPLGFRRVFEDETAIGYGWVDGEDQFCVKLRSGVTAPGAGFHLAFAAPSRSAVDAFHMAALKVGGQDNGAPGLRAHYGPDYYAAFLIDPDGYQIECVCKAPGGR